MTDVKPGAPPRVIDGVVIPDAPRAVDDEPIGANQRVFAGGLGILIAALCVAYTAFHIAAMNGLHDRVTDLLGLSPVDLTEPWRYRLIHISGGLALGFLIYATRNFGEAGPERRGPLATALTAAGGALVLLALGRVAYAILAGDLVITGSPPDKMTATFGWPLTLGVALALFAAWTAPNGGRGALAPADVVLALAAVAVGAYIVAHAPFLRTRAQVFPHPNDMWAAVAGILLILELTRRLAGLALVIIVGVFIAYVFLGPWLPGVLAHRGYDAARFFAFLYTDNGILGPTTAISSTYIILFVAFAAFLNASRVGEYFVNFAFAVAGSSRGGPAKVAVIGSGLMGMINGTSAGNVVATGSLTIPMMKKVGYRPQTAASVEAAASTGGQIMPPIMGAGAFIMAEITAIPYSEIVVAAAIPAILYFLSVYFVVDLEAVKRGMKGVPADELPKLAVLARRAFLFIPVIILIGALIAGYSVIRAGTLAMAAAMAVSWLTPFRMGPRQVLYALELAARMSLQLVAVCAAAGIIVGVIALTGIGTRFASLLLEIAESNQIIALFFAMVVALILGMGMPTTAAYTVAASVMAPGLIRLGIEPLLAHFFIFYFAVVSAITPPVALASYAGAAIAGSDPMKTSVESFRIGLAAFIVPFMFFSSPELLMQGEWWMIARVSATAAFGVFLLASAVVGWFAGPLSLPLRLVLLAGALGMIDGGLLTDALGLAAAGLVWLLQKRLVRPSSIARGPD